MDSRSEVFCPFVTHHKFSPVNRKLKWVKWLVLVELREFPYVVFIPGEIDLIGKYNITIVYN